MRNDLAPIGVEWSSDRRAVSRPRLGEVRQVATRTSATGSVDVGRMSTSGSSAAVSG
jgi:hypothetical protein